MTKQLVDEIRAMQAVLRTEATHQAEIASQRLRELLSGIESLAISDGEDDDLNSRDRVALLLERAKTEARSLRNTRGEILGRFDGLSADLGDWFVASSDEKPVAEASGNHDPASGERDRAARQVVKLTDYSDVVEKMNSYDFETWVGAASKEATIALLFTDIVGSTKKQLEMGDEAYNVTRRAHFTKADQLRGEYDAYLIKTIGDSCMVAFRTVTVALRFAVRFLGDTGHPDIRIRAGIHVGPVRVDKGDAYGTMVNVTARIAAMPTGATIWLSNEAKEQIEIEKPADLNHLKFRSRPGRTLKGLGKKNLWSVTLPTAKLQGT